MLKVVIKAVLGIVGTASAVTLAGCSEFSNILDPTFIDTLTGANQVAALPGNAPSILLTVENRTNKLAQVDVTYRTSDGVAQRLPITVSGGQQFAQAVACPVEEMTVGEITDLTVSGAFVNLGDGGDSDPFVAVEPFGVLLRDGITYECGDAVTFALVSSTATASGYRIVAFVESN